MSADARKPSSICGVYIRDVCDAPDRVVIAGAARISGVFCGGPWVAAMRYSCRCATISDMTNSSRTAAQALAMARIKNDFAGVAGSTWCAHGRSHERSIRLANARWLGPQPSIRTAGLTCNAKAKLVRRSLGAGDWGPDEA